MNKLCKSRADLALIFGHATSLIAAGKAVKVTVAETDPRSIDQNALSHQWYTEMALSLPESDATGWRRYCKLHHGVPILRAEDEEFRTVYDKAIKPHTYEDKLAMMDVLPVTSRFTKTQFTRYLDAVRDDFARRGVYLEAA